MYRCRGDRCASVAEPTKAAGSPCVAWPCANGNESPATAPGDLFIAFSTGNPNAANPDQVTHTVQTIPNDLMDPLFTGVVQATEEAVVNALVDNQAMTGRDNHSVEALPHDRLRELMKRSPLSAKSRLL